MILLVIYKVLMILQLIYKVSRELMSKYYRFHLLILL